MAGWLAVGAAVIAAVALVASAATGGQFLVVQGGSMLPALRPGDLVVVRPCAVGSLRRGDVVNYRPSSRSGSVTHRIVGANGTGAPPRLVTKGDANAQPDTVACGASNVRGKVVAVVPKVGMAARFLRTPVGFGVGVVLPSVLLLALHCRRLLGAIRGRG